MKNIVLFIAVILLSSLPTYACDICGGGLGNSNTGLLPNFNKRFVGIRYHFNQVYTQLDVDGKVTALSNKEKYHTAEIWSAWNISTRWRIMAIVPYSHIERYNYGTSQLAQKDGLGDITLSGYYNFLQTAETFAQSLWIGLGTKIPTGKYNKDDNSIRKSPNIYQLGTGSIDFIPSINYDIRLNDFGLNSNVSYKINTENNDQYRYGDRLTMNGSIYYNTALNEQVNIRPHLGLQHEIQQKDYTMGYKIDETGGYNTNLLVGIESGINQIAVGATYQTPINQHISQGRTELKNKFLVHVSYTF